NGTIISTPAGISCGATCAALFPNGTPMSLAAAPDALNTFDGWSGPCTGTGTCDFTLTADTTATAAFTGPPAAITVTAPNGGNTFTAGTTTSITWTYTGAPGNIKIELLRAGVLV